MADTFKGNLRAELGWLWQETTGGVKDDSSLRFSEQFAEGFDQGEGEAVWHLEDVALLDAANDTYDLTNLTKAVLGGSQAITLYTVRAILIINKSTTAAAGQLLIGNAASDEWSEPFGADGDIVKVPRNSPLILANYYCGWEVDDSNKNLKILASGGNVTYSIAVVGTDTIATGDCSSAGL